MKSNHKVRVGIVVHNHFPRLGGMEYCTYFLAHSLNKLPDVKACVACADMPGIPRNFPYPYRVYRPRSFSLLTRFLYQQNVKRMINIEKINILHGMMLHGGGKIAIDIGRKRGLPVVVQSRGSDVQAVREIMYGASLYPEGLASVQFSIKNSERIIALSSLIKEKIIELGGKPEKIDIIPNGFPQEEINSIPYVNLRKKYGLEDKDFVLVSVGRNRPVKRMKLLFEALSLFKKEAKKIKCICVGPKEDLPELLRHFEVGGTVFLIGRIPEPNEVIHHFPPYREIINLYRTADLYVSVSFNEAFNASALEALACGTPILVTKNQGIRDVIIEGETGFTLQEETPERLAETLLQLMQKKDELSKRREYIKNSVSHLSWSKIADRMRQVYLSLL